MSRYLLVASLLAATLGPAAPAAAAEPCQRRAGEHQLARSSQAVVFERTAVPPHRKAWVQTITGCSRSTGRRRTITTFNKPTPVTQRQLAGLHLAGTRVAYVATLATKYQTGGTSVVADDAVHGGRHHDLSSGWPFDGDGLNGDLPSVPSWAVNANGDVAWIAIDPADATYGASPPSLILWHAGLGRRQIDAKADLRDLELVGSRLSWRHNGARRSLDIAAIPRSACKQKAAVGSLDVDLVWATACLRATGRSMTVSFPYSDPIDPVDINGPYILAKWVAKVHYGLTLIDLVNSHTTDYGPDNYSEPLSEAVVDAHGSVAWLSSGGNTLWVHDANGTRTVPGKGTDRLLREDSTVTWPGGPTVTLSP
jgi:hypothetical protein